MVMAEGRIRHPMDERESRMSGVGRYLGRILVPGLALFAAAAAGFVSRGDEVPLFGALGVAGVQFDPGAWFTMGHIWILALFLILNLTGRRYGAGVAFGALMLAAAGCAGIWAYATFGAAQVIMPEAMIAALGDDRMVLAVSLSVLIGLLVDNVVFDLVRGRPWWKAPLLAPLFGGAVYVMLFHGLAGPLLGETWSERVVVHMGVFAVAVLLMVLVYHLLRPVIRPLPGYGGA